MEIRLETHTIKEVFDGYEDSAENGVVGYRGKLNIRPAFQREFVYNNKERDAVINTIVNGFPLNVMYWCERDDGGFELLDGQQRTISFCQYCAGDFTINARGFHNLTKSEQDKILNYELMIYVCRGDDKEKLDWFEIINIAGEQLTAQELKNAIYTGEWLTEAKKYFSKPGCPAQQVASDYLKGSAIRQDFLETALTWIGDRDGISIRDYMAAHQHDTNANDIWLYFQSVINWVKVVFPNYRREMKGLDWGIYYNKHKDGKFNPKVFEQRIVELMEDEDVTKNSGIYEYLLDGNERHLSIRAFTDKMKRAAYERQGGVCTKCGKRFEITEMQADHITPWSRGGRTIPENCQMLCNNCNRLKSDV